MGTTAEEMLATALATQRDGLDAIPATTRALAALYLEQGESPGWVRIDTDLEPAGDPGCTCPAYLVSRGGFRGSCPQHGRRF